LIKAGKAATASRTLAYGRACFSWAQKRGRVPTNPFIGLPIATATTSRDRVLNDLEIGAIYRGALKLGFPFGPMICVLMLTGQRRDEVAGMRWSELSDDRTTWVIPASRTKNGKAHIVHMDSKVRSILDGIEVKETVDLIFTTNGLTPVSGFSKSKKRLDAHAASEMTSIKEIPDWRFHDFRRSCVTWLAGAGFNPAVADKILNHTTATGLSTVGQVYQRAEYLSERKHALEAWAQHVGECSNPAIMDKNILNLSDSK